MTATRIAVVLCCLVASQVVLASDYSVKFILPCQSANRFLALDMVTHACASDEMLQTQFF